MEASLFPVFRQKLVLLFMFGLFVAFAQDTDPVVFTKEEELPETTFIGSVSTLKRITDKVLETNRENLRYSILKGLSNSDIVRIDNKSGNITFAKQVDREEICKRTNNCFIEFQVAVTGVESFFMNIPVKLIITDINDNDPVFNPPIKEITISESESRGFSIDLPTATDLDKSSKFSVKNYSIEPESETFDIEQRENSLGSLKINLVLKNVLNREDISSYTVLVVAKDGGSPPRSGTLTVKVSVEDYNDNFPIFSNTIYNASLREDDGPGTEVVQVFAEDKDFGKNADVLYTISIRPPETGEDIRNKLVVNETTGVITLKESLNSGKYEVFIDGSDQGEPPKSNQAVVKMIVQDTINNKPIVLISPVQVGDLPVGWVSEYTKAKTVVALLSVDDPDSGDNGNVSCFTLQSEFKVEPVPLQKSRFTLALTKQLNREDEDKFMVNVTCKDNGIPSLNSTIQIEIKVMDENDSPPEFTSPKYTQRIVENNMKGDTILVVNAVDKDLGVNAEIDYSLQGTDGNFSILQSSGVIQANIKFDRETKSKYEFTVIATDRGVPSKSGTATVIVDIIDDNDVAPIFSEDKYSFQIYENRAADSAVGEISVSDPDLNEGGKVSLSLQPSLAVNQVPFYINEEGKIYSMLEFDREDEVEYQFYVVAVDSGQRKLTSSSEVQVQILDVNDNTPSFIFPSEHNFSAYVNIPITKNDFILQIDVFDEDSSKNSIITYTIVNSNGSNLFRIGKFTGEIIANKDLGSSELGTYFITINATDQGHPALWQSRTLHLTIQSIAAKQQNVIADQNILIVACIICFTVIVCGAVLVAICVMRRMDQQKRLHYVNACCPERRQENNERLDTLPQQYDQPTSTDKELSTKSEQTPSFHIHKLEQHQQTPNSQNQRDSTNTNNQLSQRDLKRSSFQHRNNSHIATSRCNQDPTVLQRYDDFLSTSSTETATGDSGHCSDDEMSNSLDHNSTIPTSLNTSLPLYPPKTHNRVSESSGVSSTINPASPPNYNQIPPNRKGKSSSVRFSPLVTNINDNRNQTRPQIMTSDMQVRNTSNHSSIKAYPPSTFYKPPSGTKSNSEKFTVLPPRPPQLSSLRYTNTQNQPPFTDQSSKFIVPKRSPILHSRPYSNVSQSSLGENDDSDLNTTTSGSYSVASDDVAKLHSLADIKDLYV